MLQAVAFVFLLALLLTLAPAARVRSWDASYEWLHWAGFGVWLAGFFVLHRLTIRALPDRDPYLLPLAALLTGWGLLTVYRLDYTLGLRQSLWLALAVVMFAVGLRLPNLLGLLRRYKYVELTSGLLLTALTFLFGTYPSGDGPRLWLGCCGVYLQPSEPLKLLLIIFLAAYLADRLPLSYSLVELVAPTLVLTGAALVMLVAQRDLGTASLLLFLYSLIMYLASGKRRILVIAAAAILLAGVGGYQLFDVIRIRVNAWLNPWLDPSGRSYQIVQSLISVASGGVFGSGPGMGSPSVVPVAHSDFIYTAIAEETGMVGTLGLILVIALLVARGLRTALCAPNTYQRFLAAGISAYLAAQAVLITGGNLRLLPLTGVTLPFLSYGGSSLLTSFAALLLLSIISNTVEFEPAALPNRKPFLIAGGVLLGGLLGVALLNGWWGIARADDLTARADNPRPFITERFVARGALLDRANTPLHVTEGVPGEYTRRSLYPPLAATLGYTHPAFGRAGLESSLDGYLRGVQGAPSSLVLTNFLLYAQPPPGLNVRLSLDLDRQKLADSLLQGRKGALVLLNAATGEVLVMASHPSIDPNSLVENWETWRASADAPLLNRATQGQYALGAAGGPFLLAQVSDTGSLPVLPPRLAYTLDGQPWECALATVRGDEWSGAVRNGCPGALVELADFLGAQQVTALYTQIGLFQSPQIDLPVAVPGQSSGDSPAETALGSQGPLVTPLQMALAAATIAGGGQRPEPQMVLAIQTPFEGWVLREPRPVIPSLPADGTRTAAQMLLQSGTPYWQTVANAPGQGTLNTWFLAGTLPGAQGTPLALALVLEENDPALAAEIGRAVLDGAPQP